MVILACSHDDGALYELKDVEANSIGEHFYLVEVPDEITLKPKDLCVGYDSILEILLRSNQATVVKAPENNG